MEVTNDTLIETLNETTLTALVDTVRRHADEFYTSGYTTVARFGQRTALLRLNRISFMTFETERLAHVRFVKTVQSDVLATFREDCIVQEELDDV
jgi:hypothetical protein